METNAKSIIPAVATHPGSILKKELKARGITQKEFAKVIGMPAPNLNELIRGKRNVTEAIAIKLEEALGISFQNWMNLQNRYLYVVKFRQELDEAESMALAEEQSLRSRLNLEAIYKYYNINFTKSADRLASLKKLLAIDLNSLKILETNAIGYFKRSDNLKVDEKNMRTWLLLAWSEANKAEIAEAFTPEKALDAANRIAEMANRGELTLSAIRKTLNKSGIIYIHVPNLKDAPIDAYSIVTATNPAIVVTYRHNDLDKLAFDIIHEIGHITLHFDGSKSFISVDSENSSQTKEEKEADRFANDILIPPHKWEMIMSAKTKSLSPHVVVNTIAKEAEKAGISASIAVARYKHEMHLYNVRGRRSPKITV